MNDTIEPVGMTASGADPFKTFLDFVWRPDNDGQRSDAAPGETFTTVMGVTDMTWEGAQKAGIVPSDVQLTDSTNDQLAAVLKWACWTIPGAGKLAADGLPGLAVVVANMAMAAGPGTSVRLLQQTVGRGLIADGRFGPHTEATVKQVATQPDIDLIGAFTRTCLTYYASLANAAMFLRGWSRRAEQCEEFARTLA